MTDFIMLLLYINKIEKYINKSKFTHLYFKNYTTKFENLQFHLIKVFHIVKFKTNYGKNKWKKMYI